jgi:hypothetical protein
MAAFESILDTPATEIERPKPYPIGTYTCIVQGLPELGRSSKQQTEFVKFKLGFIDALDVDEAALEEAGGIQGKSVDCTFYITEKSAWRIKKFLVDDLGIDDDGKSIRDMLSEAPGRGVVIKIRHELGDDDVSVYARVASTAPIGD